MAWFVKSVWRAVTIAKSTVRAKWRVSINFYFYVYDCVYVYVTNVNKEKFVDCLRNGLDLAETRSFCFGKNGKRYLNELCLLSLHGFLSFRVQEN